MSRKIPNNLLQYIKKEMERVEYGKVIIELSESSDKVDVITQQRQRFQKKEVSENRVVRND